MYCQLFLDMLITERFPPVGVGLNIIVVYVECDCKYHDDVPHQHGARDTGQYCT